MSDIAIQAAGLSKKYTIGTVQEREDTLRDAFMAGISSISGSLKAMTGKKSPSEARKMQEKGNSVWALNDTSFEIRRGEVVGIIGHNGAGKSTLLKILSRIVEPTSGHAEIHGRVGALLEVGTGFHGELTGRENTYLCGAILGMKKSEIKQKFDEIIEFSGIGQYIDTPVKRYSSGMAMRLGFAVAAHLEPDILLVDEVLAVGDAQFQKKCLGKMHSVAGEGRTVLFVSHNMVAMQSLCQRVIWLNKGKIVAEGPAGPLIANYLHTVTQDSNTTEQRWEDVATAPGNDEVRLRRVSVKPQNGTSTDFIGMETPLLLEVEYWNLVPDVRLHITLHIFTESGAVAFTTGSLQAPELNDSSLAEGLFRSSCQIPGNFLNSGQHRIAILVVKDRSMITYQHDDALAFDVVDTSEREGAWYGREPGAVHPWLEWHNTQLA